MAYVSAPRSQGRIIVQGMTQYFESATQILIMPVVGEKYYNPDTGGFSRHSGKEEYQPITLGGLLSAKQFMEIWTIYNSPRRNSGELTAVHRLAGVKTTFTEVILEDLGWGDYEVGSNDAAKISLKFSYSGLDVVREN